MLSLWRRGLRTPLPDQTTKKLLLKIGDGGTKSDLLKITKGVLELVTIVMMSQNDTKNNLNFLLSWLSLAIIKYHYLQNCRSFLLLRPPAFKRSEKKSTLMDFRGLKYCPYNRFPCYAQTTKFDKN